MRIWIAQSSLTNSGAHSSLTALFELVLFNAGTPKECPGMVGLQLGMAGYGSFMMVGPLFFFMELLPTLLNCLVIQCICRAIPRSQEGEDECKKYIGMIMLFVVKAIFFLILLVLSVMGGQMVFGFHKRCSSPIPPPPLSDPEPDSCLCNPTMYWLAFGTLIATYPVFLFSILYFILIVALLAYTCCMEN